MLNGLFGKLEYYAALNFLRLNQNLLNFNEFFCLTKKLLNLQEFRCADGEKCIAEFQKCNHRKECTDGSDENNCSK